MRTWFQTLLAVAIGVVAVLVFQRWHFGAQEVYQPVVDELVVRRLAVVDDEGHKRITMSVEPNGDARISLQLDDPHDKSEAVFMQCANGTSGVGISDKHRNCRVAIGHSGKFSEMFAVYDADGRVMWSVP